jgi:predicted DNA-binding transcriptional regulator AlpA
MTVWRWVDKGILPRPVKINGRNYWREIDVQAVQEGKVKRQGGAA